MSEHLRQYEILREIGKGHYGTVFLAVGTTPARGAQQAKRRMVAIKRLTSQTDPEALAQMAQEFKLLDQVKHRSIVRVYEFLPEERAVVMEYVHGVTLRRVLDELGRAHEQFFTDAVVEIGCELADALFQAFVSPGDDNQPLQLVHRDLKPENLILTPKGEVKLLDFGLARVDNADYRGEKPSRVKGTPLYMAPEQAVGGAIDHRTDLFALGLILYELLSGEPAYRPDMRARDPQGEVMRRVETGQLGDNVRALEKRLPALGPILGRLLQPAPPDRYPTGHDLLVDLRRNLYRDRGASLREFADFFFGGICPLEDDPILDQAPSDDVPVKTLEERLRASMSLDREASKTPWKNPTERDPATDEQAKPVAKPKAETFVPRETGRAPPPRDPASSAPKPQPKRLGERRPDETGMLEMIPMSKSGEPPPSSDPTATTFFAIPSPKVERSSAPPTPRMADAAPPPPPSPGIRAGLGAAPPPPPTANPGTPFQVASGPAPAPTAESRVQSNLVYAVLFGAFLFVCLGVFVAVWLKPPSITEGSTTTASTAPSKGITTPTRAHNASSGGNTAGGADTAAPLKPATRPTHSNSGGSSAAGAGAGATTTPAAPKTPPGTLVIRMDAASVASSIEVACPSGFRQRATITGGVATLPGVPSEDCAVYFKGGPPAMFQGVHGGMSLSCSIIATTAVCK